MQSIFGLSGPSARFTLRNGPAAGQSVEASFKQGGRFQIEVTIPGTKDAKYYVADPMAAQAIESTPRGGITIESL